MELSPSTICNNSTPDNTTVTGFIHPSFIKGIAVQQEQLQKKRSTLSARQTLQEQADFVKSKGYSESSDSLDEDLSFHPDSQNTEDIIRHQEIAIEKVVDVLTHDDEFLIAAETGDVKRLKYLIKRGVNVQQRDYIEMNALHYAVCSGNKEAVLVLLKAGVNPTVKSNVGMTPLSLCLMRRPSWQMAKILFDYGAKLLPRASPMDTGLFLQFVMMSEPTKEEEKILYLLIEKGAKVNDLEAPGGRQALHFAAMSNNCRLIKILLDMGANVFLKNHRHETPRQVAFIFKCREAQKLLEDHEKTLNETSD